MDMMSCLWLVDDNDDDDEDDDDDYHDEDEEDMNIYDEVFVASGGKNSFTFHRLTNLGGEVLANADDADADDDRDDLHDADHGADDVDLINHDDKHEADHDNCHVHVSRTDRLGGDVLVWLMMLMLFLILADMINFDFLGSFLTSLK